MTSAAPPTEFFPGINFNASFYNLGQSAVTLDYLQSNYLRSTGYAISRAQFTLFNGTVDINENLDVSGNINASAYLLNGVPFTPSQWTTSVNDIYYTTGNVGIGKTNPTYKLDVSGNVNCNAIFTNGTQLTQYTDANVRTVLGTSAGTNMTWNTGTNKFDVAAPYTDTNVRTVLGTSAGTNMTWNTGTNKFDVAAPYTDANVRTVLGTSAGTNMTWNTGTNKFDVAAPYTDTNVRTVLSTSAGSNMTWNTGTNKFDVSVPASYTDTNTRTVLSNSAGTNMTWNTGTNKFDVAIPANPWVSNTSGIYYKPPTVPIGQFSYVGINKTNPSFELDVSGSIFSQNFFHFGGYVGIGISNPANVISGYPFQSIGNAYFSQGVAFNTTINTGVSWPGTNSVLGRAQFALGYANSTGAGDVILKSGVKLHLQSGNGEGGITVNTLNNVGIGTTAPNYKLDVVGAINATELRVNGTVFTGASQWTTNGTNIYNNNTGNVFIGASTNSSDDGNVNIAIPDSTFYVRGPRTAGTTTNISFRGGLEGNANGKVRIWLSSDAAHSSYIESHHTGSGNTNLIFGTSNGNALPTERLRIENNGNTSISGDLFITSSRLVLRGTSPTLYLRDTDQRSGMIHMNSSVMYFLNANGNDSETWLQQNGQDWCLQLNMNNNEAKFGGNIIAGSYITSSGFLQGAGAGGAYRILRYDNWVRLMNTAQNLHLDFAAGRLYAHYELDVQGASTFNAGVTFNGVVYCYNGFIIYNNLLLRLTNISSTNTDYVCVSGNTSFQSVNDKILYIANGTFTGFHRNYTDDELFDAENPEVFKNSFIGCIVISSGKIKTDYSAIEEEISEEDEKLNSSVEWKSAIGKEGIFIEDALPIVKLSRVKKDKRVFGVVGDPTRSNNSKERLIINSVGEGAICVCNTNGNIENGDYIQSSDVLGHGEKQDDDILHNYTVAKATIDCNFELNSPYYECIERPDGIRTAFIACTYHCG
jgi:hypothetical protein